MKKHFLLCTLVLALLVSGCNQGAKSDGDGDFAVSSVRPAKGADKAPLDASVEIIFNEQLDSLSVTADRVVVKNGDEVVPAMPVPTHKSIVLTRMNDLKPNTTYTVEVSPEVRSASKRRLGNVYRWQFTTGTLYSDGSEPEPIESHPFKKSFTAIIPEINEVAVLGLDKSGSSDSLFVYELPSTLEDGADLQIASRSGSYKTEFKSGAKGNLDNDSYEEAVIALWSASGANARLGYFDNNGTHFMQSSKIIDLDFGSGSAYQFQVAVEDFDGDGIDEIAAIGTDGNSAKLWVLDDAAHNFASLFTKEWSNKNGVSVLAGDYSGDGESEIIVALRGSDGKGGIEIYGGKKGNFPLRLSLNLFENPKPAIKLLMADLDDDGKNELMLASAGSDGTMIEVRSNYEVAAVYKAFKSTTFKPDFTAGVNTPVVAAAGDIDGMPGAEVVLGTTIYKSGFTFETRGSLGGKPLALSIQDANGDLNATALYFDKAYNKVKSVRYDIAASKVVIDDEITGFSLSGNYEPVVLPINVDDDTPVVHYAGLNASTPVEIDMARGLVFSDDIVIAVLAAPPCGDDIGQNTDGCSTSITTSSSKDIGGQTTVGIGVGISLGMEVSAQSGGGLGVVATMTVMKVSAKVKASLSASAGAIYGRSVTKSVGYTTPHGEDLVIFSTVPYDRYIYTVTSHPDPDMIGVKWNVDVPREPIVLAVTREYYNANNGNQPDIGSDILGHIVGQPDTYPNQARSDQLEGLYGGPFKGLRSAELISVNHGSGSNSQEIAVENYEGFEIGVEASVGQEAEVCGATVCVGFEAFYTLGQSFQTVWTEGVAFAGEVGGIDDEHFAEHRYKWGLHKYEYDSSKNSLDDSKRKFVVVNYIVEPW